MPLTNYFHALEYNLRLQIPIGRYIHVFVDLGLLSLVNVTLSDYYLKQTNKTLLRKQIQILRLKT